MTERTSVVSASDERPIAWTDTDDPSERLAQEVLSAVPYGLNRFATLTVRQAVEHGDVRGWFATLSWNPERDEQHSLTRFGPSLSESLRHLLEAVR